METELKTIARIPSSKTSKSAINQPASEHYDKLNRLNRRTESVESGIGFSNDGYKVFEEEEEGANFQINDAYSSISDSGAPSTPSLPRPINPDAYEDLNRYNKSRTGNSCTGGQLYEGMYSSPDIDPQKKSNNKTLQHQKERLYSLPKISESSDGPSKEHLQANEEFQIDMRPCYTLPGIKKQNLLYESSLTTKTKTKIDRSSNNKVQITKTNSTSTLKATTDTTRCPAAGGKRIWGIPRKQCFMSLNIIFGVIAIVALVIGVLLIFHQQDSKNNKTKFIKEGNTFSLYFYLFVTSLYNIQKLTRWNPDNSNPHRDRENSSSYRIELTGVFYENWFKKNSNSVRVIESSSYRGVRIIGILLYYNTLKTM